MLPTANQSFHITIHPDVIKRFPKAQVSCSLIEIIVVSGRKLKNPQAKMLSNYKQDVVKLLMERGVTADNYTEMPVCQSWQKVYSSFNIEGKKSTIENLIGRAVREQDKIKAGKSADLGKISNFVDCYNCVSLEEMTPMGALDAAKIEGSITLRLGREGEVFKGLGREVVEEKVTGDHIVYADEKNILTWLWNHRDAAHACVPNQSEPNKPTYILLFADQADESNSELPVEQRPGNARSAIERANQKVKDIGGKVLSTQYLSADNTEVVLQINS